MTPENDNDYPTYQDGPPEFVRIVPHTASEKVNAMYTFIFGMICLLAAGTALGFIRGWFFG